MFFLLHKKSGISSFGAISNFKKENKIKKIGHNGTLDPLAEGLLLVATDDDTKLLEYIPNKTKEYIVEATFGFETDTYDILGKIINKSGIKVTEEVLKENLKKLSKTTKQIPPKFSAKKINGVRAYELARKDVNFEINDQEIKILDYKLIDFNLEKQTYKIYFNVSEGCYIRSLIYDLGIMCGSFSTMTSLNRIGIGDLKLEMLQNLEYLKIDYTEILKLPIFKYNQNQRKYLMNGNPLKDIKLDDQEIVLLINIDTSQIGGVGKIENNTLIVKKIFPNRI
ncbi:tRNA pseudouridine(55) synthase TruB [Mycoplasmopsis anatis]|uniref:tRNA pseudouridine synthase B n=1 Tax=Mycoplasmopsis anatis 1340 TaxID=1034808 RepID=F9QD19_9BACT|nr:tRNA pseudouridine(55) synthase TruB [Mycoplasmopsis anatis]AWX70283.1 tRNA pseudouridine(55) synthase TruB [Mycoplasmopsis anatis]EGS29277.1 tRNA pseudouridine synthase B [Mycoplasmopsis anatis 1340]VEU74073.1 tRNA pseudouridine synthase B [Mycoplasmopsis anatis]